MNIVGSMLMIVIIGLTIISPTSAPTQMTMIVTAMMIMMTG